MTANQIYHVFLTPDQISLPAINYIWNFLMTIEEHLLFLFFFFFFNAAMLMDATKKTAKSTTDYAHAGNEIG